MKNGFEQFTNLYSLSKTLRFELRPVGRTGEYIQSGKFLESDEKKARDYKDVKKIIDEYHKYFIDDVLKNLSLDWNRLEKLILEYAKNKDEGSELEKEQKHLREQIVKEFISDARYKVLNATTPSDLFNKDENFKKWFENCDLELNKSAIDTFKKFSSYFTGFQENRKNVYSAEAIPTSVPYRIVHDNFPKFLQNIAVFKTIQEKCPQVISDVEKELASYLGKEKLRDIFNVQGFNKCLCQRGIDFYNSVLGGIAEKEGGVNLRGVNQFLNLYWQQHPDFAKQNKRIKMVPLFKQILSDRSSLSFKIEAIDTDEELKEAITEYADKLEAKSKDEKKAVFEICVDLFDSINEQNLSEIYVNRKDINNISRILTGDWTWLQSRMNTYADEVFKTKAEKSRWQKSLDGGEGENKSKGIFSLAELNTVLAYSSENVVETDIRITDYFKHRNRFYYENETGVFKQGEELVALSVKELCNDILNNRKLLNDVLSQKQTNNSLRDNTQDVSKIKSYLDSVQDLLHRIKPLKVNGLGDASFYAVFDSIYNSLSEVISLYNKVRNYITKKIASPEKYKLNFDNPTLADGWDLNKERDNTSILLRKDGMYYLGVMNPKDKPKFAENYNCDNEACYEKMIYKLLPGPNKMLPKVFFSAKGKETFNPPENILKGYEQGKHKKGEAFDINFCYELIDWFKSAINKHEDWKNFNFKFSDTRTYKDISDFYREVTEQGYKLSFINIPESIISQMVEKGQLYLFQIYNKDFADGASGMPNMHTLYWKKLFTEENLKDVVLKLNGEAELFYRPQGIPKEKQIVHKKDSFLVNKADKNGETIPDFVYTQIYNYKNKKAYNFENRISILTDDEKEFIKINYQYEEFGVKKQKEYVLKYRKAPHDIIKDKHYTEPKFLFHVPITINFKASGNSYSINENVCKFLKSNPDVNIIGLDRGERHLIYLSLINQKGEILKQFSFNTVERKQNEKTVAVDYHAKLDLREKERDEARKSWQSIGKIAELKEGYLSLVIHQLSKLMVEHKAIIVMEDLNFGFKRGRFHVEKQIYQKFERMLINKLNYLVFKDRGLTETGGVLSGYQLAGQFENFQKLGKQSGMLFYVPAGYTSKIDPKTGFVSMLNFKDLTNVQKKRAFFSKFDDIHFDTATGSFVFTFDYKNFDGKAKEEMFKTKWSVYSRDKRIVYYPKSKSYGDVDVTANLKSLLDRVAIDCKLEHNLLDNILEIGADLKENEKPSKEIAEFWDGLLYNFKLILQMRNSNAKTGEDYIISPVMTADGTNFDSREEFKKAENAKLPLDADANGAYHIALKGLLLLKRFNAATENELKKFDMKISNADWFKFVQGKEYAKQ